MTDLAFLQRIAYNHTGLRIERLKEGRPSVTHSDPRYVTKEDRHHWWRGINSEMLRHADYMDERCERLEKERERLLEKIASLEAQIVDVMRYER